MELNGNPNGVSRRVKLVTLGDSGAGKTTLLRRFDSNEFVQSEIPTIGIDFVLIDHVIEDVVLRVQIWDTAGQERFSIISRTYYRNSDGIFVVFDGANISSFERAVVWVNELGAYRKEIPIFLVGNKSDLDFVVPNAYRDFAKKEKLPYFEVSAKSGEGAKECFQSMMDTVYANKVPGIDPIEANEDETVAKRERCLC